MNKDNANLITEAKKKLSQYTLHRGTCRACHITVPLPSNDKLKEIIYLCRAILFPGYFGDNNVSAKTISDYISRTIDKLLPVLNNQILAGIHSSFIHEDYAYLEYLTLEETEELAGKLCAEFISSLPGIRQILATDAEAIYDGDPAAKSIEEIIYCYPSIKAISNYRIAHLLLKLNVPLIPRMITEIAHSETGIDIHPKATIGSYFAIDHGTGVVIGATTIIGEHVKLYQGVTLGAKSFPLDEQGKPIKGIPRHPIIEDNVIIYSNATILGRITIGKNATIGGNLWITKDVPANSVLSQYKK